jgi:hypothetical protein
MVRRCGLWLCGDSVHGLGEGHAEYGDEEVDCIAGALGVGISPEAVFDDEVGVFANEIVLGAGLAGRGGFGFADCRALTAVTYSPEAPSAASRTTAHARRMPARWGNRIGNRTRNTRGREQDGDKDKEQDCGGPDLEWLKGVRPRLPAMLREALQAGAAGKWKRSLIGRPVRRAGEQDQEQDREQDGERSRIGIRIRSRMATGGRGHRGFAREPRAREPDLTPTTGKTGSCTGIIMRGHGRTPMIT